MRNSFFVPLRYYLKVEKPVSNKFIWRSFARCACGSKRNADVIKSNYTKQSSKNLLDVSKKHPNFFHCKYLSGNSTRTQLMDLEIDTSPKLIPSVVRTFNNFQISSYDKEFDMTEFVENSRTALVVVSKLLSELNFSELDGLLTKECKEEVEKNVRAMNPEQRYSLAVNLDDIYFAFAFNSNIIKGENIEEKIYYQIKVVYHVCKNFESLMKKDTWERFSIAKPEMFSIYNCRFIKEFTKGVSDSWTINGINVYKMHEDSNK